VKQTALNRGFVLNKGSNHFVQVFLTDACCFLTLWLGKPLNLNPELPRLLIETDIALVRVIAAFAVVETRRRSVLLVLRFELEARREHLLHEEARRDCL